MEITLIHGTDAVAIENRLQIIKAKFEPIEITILSGEAFSARDLGIALGSTELFSSNRLVIIENINPELELPKLDLAEGTTVVLVSSKDLGVTSKLLRSAMDSRLTILPLALRQSQLIFPFLDKLMAGQRNCLVDLDPLLKEMGGIYLLTMFYYSLRKLVLPLKAQPNFAKQKINQQRIRFNNEKVADYYLLTLETEAKLKSGQAIERFAIHSLVERFLQLN